VKRALFHPQADDEFSEAIAYYARQSEGLGVRFYETIRQLTAEIGQSFNTEVAENAEAADRANLCALRALRV
jgi:hypothetical protein